jgi:formamidopyrimidine-DNA glycosylase
MKYKDFKTSDQEWPPRFMKLELEFSNGQKLAFTDSRRFGKVWYIPEKEDPYQVLPLSKLGPDAFNDLPRLSEFQDLVRKKRVPIKSLLLDQSFLAGIGNWIADEVLFQSHIHPGSSTLMLDDNELKKLHDSIQMVLSVAIDANSDSDLFPKSWIFHSR